MTSVSLASLIQQYGYAAILVGALLEGETILILGGLAAHNGHLNVWTVLVIAAASGFAGDQAYYWIGKSFGAALLRRRPNLQLRVRAVDRWFHRYSACLVIGIRFMYGFRIIGPVAIGMTSIHWLRFAVLNLAGAIVWAGLVVGAGYGLGHMAEALLGNLGQYEFGLAASIIVIALVLYLLHALRARWRKSKPD